MSKRRGATGTLAEVFDAGIGNGCATLLLAAVIVGGIASALAGAATWGWNEAVVPLFGAPTVSFAQALGLLVVWLVGTYILRMAFGGRS